MNNVGYVQAGGIFDDERKMDELKQLYRAYLTEALSSGQLEEDEVIDAAIIMWQI